MIIQPKARTPQDWRGLKSHLSCFQAPCFSCQSLPHLLVNCQGPVPGCFPLSSALVRSLSQAWLLGAPQPRHHGWGGGSGSCGKTGPSSPLQVHLSSRPVISGSGAASSVFGHFPDSTDPDQEGASALSSTAGGLHAAPCAAPPGQVELSWPS